MATYRSGPAVTKATCIILHEGHEHEIVRRPSSREILHRLVGMHGKSEGYAPQVTFRVGGVRRIIIHGFTRMTPTELHFTATMPNGNNLVRVAGAFTGTSGGYIVVTDSSP